MKTVLLLFLSFFSGTAFAQSNGHVTIVRSVVAGGGEVFSITNRFKLRATIGQPAVSGVSSGRFSLHSGFWYHPSLEVIAAAKIGTNFVFSFETELGKTYSVQYADSLASPSWQVFADFTGDGIAKTVTQSTVGVTNRFYRVIQHQ